MTFAEIIPALSAVFGAVSAVGSANAQAAQANYQAQVAANNAITARRNANYVEQAGQTEAQQRSLRAAATGAAIEAAEAGQGMDVGSGSNLNMRVSQRQIGALETQQTMANALMQAYGYRAQATNFDAQAQLDRMRASQMGTQASMAWLGGGFRTVGAIFGAKEGGGGLWGGSETNASGTETTQKADDMWFGNVK